MNAFVYIMANCPDIARNRIIHCGLQENDDYHCIVLYTGVTSFLYKRITQHKEGVARSLRSHSSPLRAEIPDQVRYDGDKHTTMPKKAANEQAAQGRDDGDKHSTLLYHTNANANGDGNGYGGGKPLHFTEHYHCDKLVYFETLPNINDAIKREKQLKKWKRHWKLKLITDFNPKWYDLFFTISPNL